MNGYCGGDPTPEETRAWRFGAVFGFCYAVLALGCVLAGVAYGEMVGFMAGAFSGMATAFIADPH
jgi:hypothetical protein